jgi:hypothetical protein
MTVAGGQPYWRRLSRLVRNVPCLYPSRGGRGAVAPRRRDSWLRLRRLPERWRPSRKSRRHGCVAASLRTRPIRAVDGDHPGPSASARCRCWPRQPRQWPGCAEPSVTIPRCPRSSRPCRASGSAAGPASTEPAARHPGTDRHHHFAGQVRAVERVRVADPLVGDELSSSFGLFHLDHPATAQRVRRQSHGLHRRARASTGRQPHRRR